MASIQHVYRRGHIFWWRRVLRIHGESGCDIRLSLGTADRRRARELGGIHYIQIDYTETGRIKNEGSIRAVPLHRELIRLGILDFVDVCRREGRDVLFPELRPTNETQKFGDVFYKRCWVNIRKKGPSQRTRTSTAPATASPPS